MVQILPTDYLQEISNEVPFIELVYIVSAIQYALYSVVLGILGKYLSQKIGIWRKLEFSKAIILKCIIASVIGGLLLIGSDVFIFNALSDTVKATYDVKPTIENFIASIVSGGVIEEIMLRLFSMSLIGYIIHKLSKKEIDNKTLVFANIIAAVLFSALHIPSTAILLGITPVTLIRGFLLNGSLGLLFGRFYRKHGIQYAMITHAGVHIVCKLVWLLFV